MSERILDYAQEQYPHPISDTVSGLKRAISSHEKRDRIIEVFRTSIRLLCACAIGVRGQFGEGPDGASKTLGGLVEGLRRRGLTDGQWVSILRELLREYKSKPEAYPIQGMVELFHKKKAKFAKLANELLDMRKSQTVAHGRVFDEDDLLQIIEERMPHLEDFLEQLKPIFDRFRLSLGNGTNNGKGISILHGLGSTSGTFPTTTATEEVGEEQLCIVNSEHIPVVFLHPSALFRSPLPELPKELFVFERRGKKGAKLLSLPNMYEIEMDMSWDPIEQAFFSGEDVDVAPEIEGIEKPFRGLEAFQPEHYSLFFGRNEEAEELTNRIRKSGFVVLTGPSGTGKSSLIQAGVVPQIKNARMFVMRPGNHPLQSLNQILQAMISKGNKKDLEEAILKGQEDVVADILFQETAKSDQLTVLVVDQGEELVTLCSDSEKREQFGAILSVLGQSYESNMRIVYSLREDFFGPVGALDKIKSIFSRQVMVISTPKQEELMLTLIGPARLFGYQFEDFTLLQEMTQAVECEPAALALLQFCADKMWDRRDRHRKYLTRDSYEALGGVGGALANHAEEVMQSLPPLQQEQLKSIFLRLVTEERTKQLCSRTELVEGAKNRKAAEQLLDSLIKVRLLTSRSDIKGRDTYCELVHEALISHWGRLKDWLLANQEGQRTLISLRTAAQEWEHRKRNPAILWDEERMEELRVFKRKADLNLTELETAFVAESEKRVHKKVRIRQILIGTAFTLVTLFAVFMFWQYQEAEEQRKKALYQLKQHQAQQLLTNAVLKNSDIQFYSLISTALKLVSDKEVPSELQDRYRAIQHQMLGKEKMNLELRSEYDVSFSRVGENEILVSNPTSLQLINFKSTEKNYELPSFSGYVQTLHSEQFIIILASQENFIYVHDKVTGVLKARFHHPRAGEIYLSPDGNSLISHQSLTGPRDSTDLYVWDLNNLKSILYIPEFYSCPESGCEDIDIRFDNSSERFTLFVPYHFPNVLLVDIKQKNFTLLPSLQSFVFDEQGFLNVIEVVDNNLNSNQEIYRLLTIDMDKNQIKSTVNLDIEPLKREKNSSMRVSQSRSHLLYYSEGFDSYRLFIQDIANGRIIKVLTFPGPLSDFEFLGDETFITNRTNYGTEPQLIQVWNATTGEKTRSFTASDERKIVLSESKKHLLVLTGRKGETNIFIPQNMELYNLQNNTKIFSRQVHQNSDTREVERIINFDIHDSLMVYTSLSANDIEYRYGSGIEAIEVKTFDIKEKTESVLYTIWDSKGSGEYENLTDREQMKATQIFEKMYSIFPCEENLQVKHSQVNRVSGQPTIWANAEDCSERSSPFELEISY